MTADLVPIGSPLYLTMLLLLFFGRGMDILSTWIATPGLVLEANPLAKALGWKAGLLVNGCLCLGFAAWPLPAIVIATASILVAARNLNTAWLMRSLGEQRYRCWIAERLHEASFPLYVFCLLTQTALIAGVGVGVIWFSRPNLVPFAIGTGILTYALAVAFYTLLSIWRLRRSAG